MHTSQIIALAENKQNPDREDTDSRGSDDGDARFEGSERSPDDYCGTSDAF
jgi:hypothetical protein